MGFKPFDPSLAGVYGDKAWKQKAIKKYPEVVFAKTPERFVMKHVNENFDNVPVNTPFPNPHVNIAVENKGDKIIVTDEVAFSGKHSLKMLGTTGRQHGWTPHFYFRCNFTNSTVENSFVVRAQEGVYFSAEWREYKEGNNQYITGPCLIFQNGKVFARTADGQKEIATLPSDTWAKIRVWAAVGKKFDGTWSVSVGDTEVTGLRIVSPDFRVVHWLGFSTHADRAVAYDLDDFVFGER
jgi:outer membrane protein assembly factor BamB